MKSMRIALLLAAAVLAGTAAAGEMAVEGAWARATAPGASVGAAYLTIVNAGAQDDTLLSVASAAAGRVEVHATELDGEVARMRKLGSLPVAAGERVVLAPGGVHVMLMELGAPLRQGEKLELLLRFEQAGEVRVEADILAPGTTDPHAHHRH